MEYLEATSAEFFKLHSLQIPSVVIDKADNFLYLWKLYQRIIYYVSGSTRFQREKELFVLKDF